jgi:hypothetical protein
MRKSAFIFALFALSSLTISHCLGQSIGDRVSATNFNGQITGLKTIQEVSYKNQPFIGKISTIAFDDQFAYLSTPDGLFRSSRIITPDSPLTFLGFANYTILNLYVHENVLYVAKAGGDPRSNTLDAHSFLKSTDHGQTFIPLDEGLKWCFRDDCQYMYVSQVFFINNLIFITSGGGSNFYVSNDGAKSWRVLMGFSEPAVCSDVAIAIIGRKVLMGGECPLDFAYLGVGTLREDMLGWDARTRISLFATNIPPADEDISAITVKAEDTQHNIYQLPVEWVGRAPGYPWMTQIVVRLPDGLAHAGDVNVQIAAQGSPSNNALLSIH